ncbi:TRAP transporter small permease [Halobacillus sp. ACCC02827]|uniref:TRAP transporter small permease n=1 Tax=Bacillaceae TaxID=186817 RepID=UPI0002A4DFD8|nr:MULTISPECIES: TRAP transporter small permease [Bacillaceae]ELK44703.1 hypothetical protein D479_18269 [Halobacillus sp. BAB-2008]QHT46963.1 TRAP transporter small permease [Bacillus sp. SB49]WJE14189.1 TRAP transporter small permease [Halobacillus sp. ACCC02827]
MIKLLERVQLTIGVVFLLTFFVTIVIQVVTRFMGISAIWTEELATYSFIWSVFMGAGVMVNRREHFQFDFLLRKAKGKYKNVLYLINDLIILLFSTAIVYFGWQAAVSFWDYEWVSIEAMKMGYVWISVPVMGATMAVYTLGHVIKNIKEFSKEEAAL